MDTSSKECPSLYGTRILVVEDASDMRDLVSLLLTRHGARVEAAADGIEGLERAQNGTYSAIVLDVGLPYLGGAEIVRRIREQNPRIPIVAVTARTSASDITACYRSGCNRVMQKPFRAETLIATLLSFLGQEAIATGVC